MNLPRKKTYSSGDISNWNWKKPEKLVYRQKCDLEGNSENKAYTCLGVVGHKECVAGEGN